MPHIVFDGPELSKEKKKKLIKNFTNTASKVTNIPREAFVVMIKENDLENIGVGGELLSEKK